MDEKQDYLPPDEPILESSNGNEASYEELSAYFAAKRKIIKGKKISLENTPFLQACSKIYNIGPKFFSEAHYQLLKQHPKLTEEIISDLRPATLQALFGNNNDSENMVQNRVFILAVLHKNGVIKNKFGKITDQDWIKFLNSIDKIKLNEYARVFAQISDTSIDNIQFFSHVKAHNDLESLAKDLQSTLAFHKAYGLDDILRADTQIKGFTLINEYVCKRTRFFPKAWKIAMRAAWEIPSSEASFELYKLYSERQIWLDGYINFPVIHRFLSYFYRKPIFQTFDTEPLTQVCKLLQSVGELDMDNYKLIEDMPETGLAFCKLLNSKGILNAQYLQKINGISESTLQHICEENEKHLITLHTLNLLLKLGKKGIDGTTWMVYKPNWLIISKLSDNSLKTLGTIELNEQIFEQIKNLYELGFMQVFDKLNESQQKNMLTNVNYEKISTLLLHLEKIGLFTPENVKSIFDNQTRLLKDNKMFQSILNLEKNYVKKDQKRFERIIQSTDTKSATKMHTPAQLAVSSIKTVLSTLTDEQIAQNVSKKLRKIGIAISEEELGAYSPAVLLAFHAALPLFSEDNLLSQNNIQYTLRLFSAAPDPQARCRCIVILSQCGLLIPEKLYNNINKLEYVMQENPDLFLEIYTEAWVQKETNSKWLEKTLSAGLQETDPSLNKEETLIKRFLIENEENAAYLALDDTKEIISTHAHPPLVQQTIKLLDKSKIRIESVLRGLMQTNTEQIQKIYAWLFILDKAELLNPNTASQILKLSRDLPGNLDYLKNIVASIKAQPELKLNTYFKQKLFDQLLKEDTALQSKQKILDYIQAVIQNPSTAARLAYMVSDVAEVAGEKAVVVQDKLKKGARVLAIAATNMSQQVYGKIKMFRSKAKPTVTELLPIATQNRHFNGSYYQTHLEQLNQDLNALLSQDLLSEPNVDWLVLQPNQEVVGRCLRLLANANMLKDDDQWQNKVGALAAYDAKEFAKLEGKCQRVLSSTESKDVKAETIQMWIEPVLLSLRHSPGSS